MTAGGDARVVLEGRTELAVDRGPEAYQLAYVTAPTVRTAASLVGSASSSPTPTGRGRASRSRSAERTTNPRVAEKVADAPAGFFLNWPIQLLLEDAASVRTGEGLEEPLRSFAFG